jgi:hypothetical protein
MSAEWRTWARPHWDEEVKEGQDWARSFGVEIGGIWRALEARSHSVPDRTKYYQFY